MLERPTPPLSSLPRRLGRGQAGAVVRHLQAQPVAGALGPYLHAAGGGARRDAVADGVLDDGLQDEVGHLAVERLRIDEDLGGEPVVEARALDVEVAVEKLQLLAQPDLLRGGVVEREAQEVAELRDHVIGGLRIFVCECGN